MSEKLDLSELERLCAAATPEPWHLSKDKQTITQTRHLTRDVWVIPRSDEDMEAIVALRNAAPQMLSRLRALERVAAERDEALRLASKFAQSMIDALRKNQAPPLDIRDTDRLLAMRKEAGL